MRTSHTIIVLLLLPAAYFAGRSHSNRASPSAGSRRILYYLEAAT